MKSNENFNNYDICIEEIIWSYKQDLSSPWTLKTYSKTDEDNVYELMYISKGSFKSYTSQDTFIYGAGELILRNTSCSNGNFKNSSNELPFIYHSIIFRTKDPIKLKETDGEYYSVKSKFNDDIETQFLKAFEIFIDKPPYYHLAVKSILYDILKEFFLADLHAEEKKVFPDIIRKCLTYIQNNAFSSTININNLAAKYNISSAHFIREFKKYIGMPPKQYILNLRLSRSKGLLKHTKLPISEISEMCGFENVTYFNRVFKQKYNKTPSGYRNF